MIRFIRWYNWLLLKTPHSGIVIVLIAVGFGVALSNCVWLWLVCMCRRCFWCRQPCCCLGLMDSLVGVWFASPLLLISHSHVSIVRMHLPVYSHYAATHYQGIPPVWFGLAAFFRLGSPGVVDLDLQQMLERETLASLSERTYNLIWHDITCYDIVLYNIVVYYSILIYIILYYSTLYYVTVYSRWSWTSAGRVDWPGSWRRPGPVCGGPCASSHWPQNG